VKNSGQFLAEIDRLELDGPSMRKIKAAETSEPAATTATDDKPKGAKK